MFTGIVTDIGQVAAVEDLAGLAAAASGSTEYDAATIALGASIACSGPCLTVTGVGPRDNGAWFDVDCAAETLERTTAGDWRVGTQLNLERSLKIGDELGGHIVTGHVDGIASIVGREEVTDGEGTATARFVIAAPREVARFIAAKGSVPSMAPRSRSTRSRTTRSPCSLSRTRSPSRPGARAGPAIASTWKSI